MKNKVTSISANDALIRTQVPIKIKEGIRAQFFTFNGLSDLKEHIAVVFGDITKSDITNIRLHSECLTGDVFGSQRCDCGYQLNDAIDKLSKDSGVLLYLRQEGRGIGLYEKLAAYDVQISEDMDTYAANIELGHAEDIRDFKIASEMLGAININKVNLLTNNPDKAFQLEKYGISVKDIIPTHVHVIEDNKAYLSAKADSGRHKFRHHPRDIYFMNMALEAARSGLGRTAPNPSVGCVLVKDEEVIAISRTADTGRPHAETQALEVAGVNAKGAEMFVTLEPCNHEGKTAPCVNAIIDAGIKRVVISCQDPHTSTNGASIQKLKDANIEVVLGVRENEALRINQGFFLGLTEARPFVTLKVATTLDGKIASKTGHSKWITSEAARKRAHILRARHDAILVGSGTYLADDPDLSVRDVEYDGPLKQKFVLDRTGSVDTPKEGFEVLAAPDIKTVLKDIASKDVTRLMVEGGGQVLSSFLKSGLWDELYWFRAPKLLGNDGVPAFGGFDFSEIGQSHNLNLKSQERVGEDTLEIWTRI